jgi:hypothetical protein
MWLNETYSKICIGKHLYDNFPIWNYLKHGDALSSLISKFAFEYAIRKVQENQVGLLLAQADDLNLRGNNIDTIKRNIQILIDSSKEVGLEVTIEETKYMLLNRHRRQGKIVT